MRVDEASVEEEPGHLLPVDGYDVTGPLGSNDLLCQVGGWVQDAVGQDAPQNRIPAQHLAATGRLGTTGLNEGESSSTSWKM